MVEIIPGPKTRIQGPHIFQGLLGPNTKKSQLLSTYKACITRAILRLPESVLHNKLQKLSWAPESMFLGPEYFFPIYNGSIGRNIRFNPIR